MDALPLPALLSAALVAFTIEFDNEAEHHIPHGSTRHGATRGPQPKQWLTSLVMYLNCMQYVTEEGITVPELERLARTPTNLNGMQRWRAITVENGIIRPTAAGRKAQQIWRPLFGIIEDRWRERFGQNEIAQLRDSLAAIAQQLPGDLPDCMPILGYGLITSRIIHGDPCTDIAALPLVALLARVQLAFALEFENESPVSLAIAANVLRLTGDEGVRVRDLPQHSGVSKEAIAMATGFLERHSFAKIKPESASSRTRLLVLSAKGRQARQVYHDLVRAIEDRWQTRFGVEPIKRLRASLELLDPLLFRGLEPYPDGWRASVPKPATLPHFPMVLHRGGFPDGS